MTTETLWIAFSMLGLIIGLGAVTVIDIHGALATRSGYWTEATIRTHYVTKPLIWIGTLLFGIGSLLAPSVAYSGVQLASVVVLVANGLFLSFVVSPFLKQKETLGTAAEILPATWQYAIAASFLLSVTFWWGNVAYFIWRLSLQP